MIEAYETITGEARKARSEAAFHDVLIEEMCTPGEELIVGAFNEPQLGPVVMCGLGGVFVEVLRDVAFRVAPITARDAREMWTGLVGAPILRGARGRPPLDTDALESLLLRIGGAGGLLAIAGDNFSELDLNPVFLYPRGLRVVDARLILRPAGSAGTSNRRQEYPPDKENLAGVMRAIFDPSSIAVIGASPEAHKLGFRIVKNLVDFGFQGKVYPVHPSASEIYGVAAYPSLSEIPGPVDRAIVAVSAAATPKVMMDCAEKGIVAAQIYTAGFGELSEHGAFLERQLVVSAGGRVRIVGPNCYGTYAPASRITMVPGASPEPGPIGFISQSGGLTLDAVRRGGEMGLRYRKAISIGNSVDLGASDFLWDFAQDDEVKLIGMYLEAARDERRLAESLREIGPRKPVVILKGGQTRTGSRAAASHTGAVASDSLVWRGLFHQTGVSAVESVEEFFDTMLAFQTLPLSAGPRVALIGPGGGASVLASDAAERAGLEVPLFEPVTVQALAALGLPPGTSLVNPLDVPASVLRLEDGRVLGQLLDVVIRDAGLDAMLVHLNTVAVFTEASGDVAANYVENMVTAILEVACVTARPLGLVFRHAGDEEQERVVRLQRKRVLAAGVPVFATLDLGLRALGHMHRYSRFRETYETHEAGVRVPRGLKPNPSP
ncbi:MAG: acetate--CoA ligase family protein [Chloroflexi bacterium]|nr:acetate--CoA ligase family protein [Chloroflexota bacterium]